MARAVTAYGVRGVETYAKTTVKTTGMQSHSSSTVTMTTALTTHMCVWPKINTPVTDSDWSVESVENCLSCNESSTDFVIKLRQICSRAQEN